MNNEQLRAMLKEQLDDLLKDLRNVSGRLKYTLEMGQMVKLEEVTDKSFVQMIESVPIPPQVAGEQIVYTYRYHQYWMDQCPQSMREKIVGSFIGERVGQAKIIGIYEVPVQHVKVD